MRFFVLFFAFAAAPAVAQDWATRALCFSEPLPITAEDVAPFDLAQLEKEAALIPNARGKFWQVTHPNGTTSFLWGTMHTQLASVLALPKPVMDAIASSDQLALEFDATFQDREALEAYYDTPGRYREPANAFAPIEALDLSFLGDTAATWIRKRLEETGYGEDSLYSFTYAGLAEFLLSDPCADFTNGVFPIQDNYIHTLAHIAGARVISLEDSDDFLYDLSQDASTAKAVVATYASYLEPLEEVRNFNAAAQLYAEGRLGFLSVWDAAHVSRIYGASGRDFVTKTNDYLLAVRNQRFVEVLRTELSKGATFIAVGAAHLPGETGLVSLLRDEGFEVERILLPKEAK